MRHLFANTLYIHKKPRLALVAGIWLALSSLLVLIAPTNAGATSPDEANPGVAGKQAPSLDIPDVNADASPNATDTSAADPIRKCGPNSPGDKDSSRWGKYFKYNYTLIYREPNKNSTRCAQGQKSHTVDYHCWVLGRDGYTWTYLRDATTKYAGWVRDTMLTNYGSMVHC